MSESRQWLDTIARSNVLVLTNDEREALRQYLNYDHTMAYRTPGKFWTLIEAVRQKLGPHGRDDL